MSYYINLALLTLALSAALVQSAPRDAVLTIYRVEQAGSPANNIGFPENPKMVVQMIPEQLSDVSAVQMHFLQLNLLKILIILDVIILMCVYYSSSD